MTNGTYKYLIENKEKSIKDSSMKNLKKVLKESAYGTEKRTQCSHHIISYQHPKIIIVTYTLNIINWKLNDINKLDTKTTKRLIMRKMHHTMTEVDRIYLPRTS